LIRQLFWIICSEQVLRLGLETIFLSLSLGLEGFRSHLALKGYRSRSQACCLETVNIARIWLCKTSVIQRVFFSVVLVSKKQPKQIGKMPKIQLQSSDDNFLKNFSKMHKFQNLKFRYQSFNKVSVSKVSLDYITDYVTKKNNAI